MEWPDNRRAAVVFSFDFDAEEVWIGEDRANEHKPGVLSQGTYGAKVAVPAILELLDRHGMRASFFVPGRVAERHPGRVEAILAAGHEVAHHGYTHTSPTTLSRAEEEDELLRGREALERVGARIRGYRSPSWDLSPNTLDLLREHGFAYASNLMDDIAPYRHEGSGIVELPIQWILDDAPHFWFDGATWTKKISTPSEVREIWEAEVLGIREMGGLAIVTTHPQIIGRPGRLPLLDAMLGFVRGLDDVWLTTCGEVAERVP